MGSKTLPIQQCKRIALVAHDNKKVEDYEPYMERQVEALVADKMEELENDWMQPSDSEDHSSGNEIEV